MIDDRVLAADDLTRAVDELFTIVHANATLSEYHENRRRTLTRE